MKGPIKRSRMPKRLFPIGRHLVYSEGTVTEPNYVSSVRKAVAKARMVNENDIALIPVPNPGKRTLHTMALFDFASKDVAKRIAYGEQVDCVWIFFDKDSFADYWKAYQAIEAKNSSDNLNKDDLPCDENGTAWIPCWSNQCFELWVYLHYEDLTGAISRHDYINKINAFIKNRGNKTMTYAKNRNGLLNLFSKTGGDSKKAIKLAKNKGDDPRVDPATAVFIFASYFMAYIDNPL